MKKVKSTQVKASILLVVFSLNIIIGFACSLGLDMGFNSHHHHDEEAREIAIHSDGSGKQHHHHGEAAKILHKKPNDKDNCCNDKVTKIVQQDKEISQSISIINSIFFTSFISSFSNTDIFCFSNEKASIRYFIRSYHPPILYICIAIQSFQI